MSFISSLHGQILKFPFFFSFFFKLKLTGIRITFTLNFEDFAILIVFFFFRYLRRNDKKTALLCFISKVILCYQLKKRSHIFQNPGQSGQKAKANLHNRGILSHSHFTDGQVLEWTLCSDKQSTSSQLE